MSLLNRGNLLTGEVQLHRGGGHGCSVGGVAGETVLCAVLECRLQECCEDMARGRAAQAWEEQGRGEGAGAQWGSAEPEEQGEEPGTDRQ